ncbi:MAG TPA: DUF1707 domain-containing protein [Kribbella sp.]|jgi:hypothetical protein
MSGNEERPGGSIRIGDHEREDAVTRLGAHYEAGRLSAEEHQERVGEALQAKTAAELAALFADLPEQRSGEQQAGPAQGEPWAGPWGWSRPPWTTPEGQGAARRGGPGRPPWAARGPFGKIPFPLLIALAVIGVLASIGCVVGGGHPPVLPLLLIVAGIFIVKKRRQERRA